MRASNKLGIAVVLSIGALVSCVVATNTSTDEADLNGSGSGGSNTCSCGCGSSCCDCGSDPPPPPPPPPLPCGFHDGVCGGSCPTSPVMGPGRCTLSAANICSCWYQTGSDDD